MNLMTLYLPIGAILLVTVSLIWLLSVFKKDTSIIDPCWSLLFLIAAATAYFYGDHGDPRAGLLLALVVLWSVRLALHLVIRSWGEGEDYRYRAWREEHGTSWWWRSYFTVFLLQGLLAWIISIPLVVPALALGPPLGLADLAAVLLWLIGFFFEAVGDWQLRRFKADPANKGKLLDRGLWAYSRHPNYFGEALQWWGFYLLAALAGSAWTLYAPLLMSFLLMRVSGVTLLEKSLVERKPGYRAYIETTPAFFPRIWGKKNGGRTSGS